MEYVTIKQQCIFYNNITASKKRSFAYSKIFNVIEKALWKLVEEYYSIGKSFHDLIEDYEKKMVQLTRIRATVDMRWNLKRFIRKSKINKHMMIVL